MIDLENYKIIRSNVNNFIKEQSILLDKPGKLLDIAPQIHQGARAHFEKISIYTLDMDPNANSDYRADICQNNCNLIPDEYFDIVVCTEVLEHVNQPFDAVNELFRLTKKGGYVLASTPFDFRIHGPLPDNWRFTIHGLNQLFKKFSAVEIIPLEKERFLMPIHYTLIAKK